MDTTLTHQRRITAQLKPEEFLSYFPGYRIQYFDDRKRNKSLALDANTFNATQARRKQEAGCGIFFCTNASKGNRRIKDLVRIQTLFVDIDCAKESDNLAEDGLDVRKNESLEKLLNSPRRPHGITETKNGLHAYWLIHGLVARDALELFATAEAGLIAFFGADESAKDPTRVLRLPDSFHQKNLQKPFLCKLIFNELSRDRYALNDLLEAFPIHKKSGKIGSKSSKNVSTTRVREGGRNVAAASITGKILSKLDSDDWEMGWEKLQEWNRTECIPPLAKAELRQVFENIIKKSMRDAGEKKGEGQAAMLIQLAEAGGDVFFHDEYNRPHVAVKRGQSHVVFGVTDKAYRDTLVKKLWDEAKKVVTHNIFEGVISVLAAKAMHDGPQIPLHNRVAFAEGVLWYDLSDDNGRAVRVTASGYEVVDNPPILFRRYAHQRPQVVPSLPGEADALLFLDFINLPDPEQQRLLMVWLATCFFPDIPHPIINFYGPQGSSKTVLARMLTLIIDPSVLETLSLSARIIDLIQKLDHHWFLFFDNLQKLPVWISDELCRAVTGGGFSRRELYTNDEDIIRAFRRCIGLNGINLVATRPDLLDRSILFRFNRIEEHQRTGEEEIWRKFEELKPKILGGIFNALSIAMRREKIILTKRPRMADFAEKGCAVAEGLGIPHENFLMAYKNNRAMQHEEAIYEDPVGIGVIEYLKEEMELRGTPSHVYRLVTNFIENSGIRMHQDWPNSPQSFTRRLNELATNLLEIGIRVSTHGKKNGERWTIIEYTKAE